MPYELPVMQILMWLLEFLALYALANFRVVASHIAIAHPMFPVSRPI